MSEAPDDAALAAPTASAASISAMRDAIDGVDHSLLELVARRRALVTALLAAKVEVSLPLVDPTREEALIADRRAFAEGLGMPSELGERVARLLLDDSHEMIKRLLEERQRLLEERQRLLEERQRLLEGRR